MTETYINTYEVEYLFEEMPNGVIKWTGPFEGCRMKESDGRIKMVNPKGGPQLKKGQMLSHVIRKDFDVLIDHFERIEEGFLIKTRAAENDGKTLEEQGLIPENFHLYDRVDMKEYQQRSKTDWWKKKSSSAS